MKVKPEMLFGLALLPLAAQLFLHATTYPMELQFILTVSIV